MPTSALFLPTISPSAFIHGTPCSSKAQNTKTHLFPTESKLKHRQFSSSPIPVRCGYNRANSSSSSPSWVLDYDLYELLGVERSSDQSQIKAAYRALQKRCHPDIVGAAGHDMAVVLNEVYGLLSDPTSRSAYDREQAKMSEFQGFTGKPLYSTWFGSENEERAVFVDEVRCVGCLKCALFANRTFAIESVYGRARVVAQWAEPEDKILDAIQTCPVDCISMVERSDLAALEFLMSKQPRGNVRMSQGNTAGARVSNIFSDLSKFQRRYNEMKDKASREDSKEADLQTHSRMSAIQGIRSIANWWYQPYSTATPAITDTCLNLTTTIRKTTLPNTERIREVAAKLKARAVAGSNLTSHINNEEYWTPSLILPSPPTNTSSSSNTSTYSERQQSPVPDSAESISGAVIDQRKGIVMSLGAPVAMALVSAAIVGLRGEEMSGSGLTEHIGGSAALAIVNSFELQVLLAGGTWFVIGMMVVGLVYTLGSKGAHRR